MEELRTQIGQIVNELFDVESELTLSRTDEQFGDYATNVAMQLAGRLNKSPQEIAETICGRVAELGNVSKAEVAGPGFINIRLADSYLSEMLTHEPPKIYTGQKVVIETNNPNPFKDIHIGHAMNAIVADTIANLLQQGGAEVIRVSYHGDVGLHVAKSLWAILNEFGDAAGTRLAEIPANDRPRALRDWYARGAGLYEEDPAIKTSIEELIPMTFKLEDPSIKAIYDIGINWSFTYFDSIFARLGSQPITKRYLESDADKEGRQIVEANIGTVFENSDGAVIFDGDKHGLHTRVFISSRDTTLYEARDLGLMILKDRDFAPDMSYIVTAEEQKEYFKVVLKAADLANPALAGKTTNISTGTVKLTTGKMSSRTGDVVNISWLFEALSDAVESRGAKDETIETSVVAALRYTMLKNRLTSDTIFDVEQAVALEGNTGPYLQYAHARAYSILKKADSSTAELSGDYDQAERSLLKKMTEFQEVVKVAVSELMPHHVCTYLFELAQAFNSFYEHNRVIGDERSSQRLSLVAAYAQVLHRGLSILGIAAPEHM